MVEASDAGPGLPALSVRLDLSPLRDEIEAFYTQVKDRAFIAVLALGADPEEARDAVSVAMVRILERWGKEVIQWPVAYTSRTAVNAFLAERRAQRSLGTRLRAEWGDDAPKVDDGGLSSVWDGDQFVESLLACLGPEQASVMREAIQGSRVREIALALGKTPDAVRKNLQLARRRLRAEWERCQQPGQIPQPRSGHQHGSSRTEGTQL